jgi:3-oxoacyl-[acyl-carrier-protein] synthase-3
MVLPAMTSSAQAPSSGVFVTGPGYALGEIKAHVTESAAAGRLHSAPDDLASAGFAWHYVSAPGSTAYDLARSAVRALPGEALSGGVDAVIHATCLPCNGNVGSSQAWRATRDVTHLMDYPGSRLQADFALDRAIVIGLSQQGCTSMLGAIRLGAVLLASEPQWAKVLCVTADRFPAEARYEHSYNLVSDSAAACVVTRQQAGFRLLTAHQITNGGLHGATDDETVGTYFSYVRLLVTQTLDRAGVGIGDIAWIVPQNTNQKAWQILSRMLGVEFGQVWQPSLPDHGHAISADNLINLAALADSGQLRAGQRILLVVAGYGLNWQAMLLEATGATGATA